MLENQGMSVIQFVQCNVYHEVLLGEGHVLIHLKSVSDFGCLGDC